MSFRGRGRGWGRFGGGGGGYARQEPFVVFPEIELPDHKNVKEEIQLVALKVRLQIFWESSPYYLEENDLKKNQSMDVERYSDRGKMRTTSQRDSLDAVLQYGCENFPRELIGGSRREQRKSKKVRWNPDLQKLDLLEKLEQKYKGQEDKGEKEKKEGEEEEENEDDEAGEEEEDLSDDDYKQNFEFDDDEDDFNPDDDGDANEEEY